MDKLYKKKSRKSKRSDCTSQNQHDDTWVAKVLQEVSVNQEQRNENVKSQLSRQRKRLKNSKDVENSLLDGEVLKKCTMTGAKRTQTTTDPKRAPENTVIDTPQPSTKVPTVAKNMSLRKCENTQYQISCAFCHSSKESELSGKMMHYSNGKPVAPDFKGESSIINVHRNCTEWAPNVYFEDETAINLESELSRSKKIKCSLCGIKGAALGCYEKSCRKSFHVTCAKLVQQCRWDTDNFVMLYLNLNKKNESNLFRKGVKACMESMKPVCEEKYEINVDIHGIRDGPKLGRLRVLNKDPKLFYGCNFYFFGEFLPSYKGYLQDMVVAAGGTVLQRKPISESISGCSSAPRTFIIYNVIV